MASEASTESDGRLTQAQLARALGVSRQAIHQHVKADLIAPDADGLFDLEQARGALRVLHPRGKLDISTSALAAAPPAAAPAAAARAPAMDYHTARTLLMVNEARLAQLKVMREEKSVLDAEDVHRSLMTAMRELRDLLLAMGRQVAPRVAPMTAEADVREAIDAHVRTMLGSFVDKSLPDLQHRLFGPRAAAAPLPDHADA